MNQYQEVIHKTRYARWLPEEGRRESWQETVQRYVRFWEERGHLEPEECATLFDYIFHLEVMPSMRCLMTAGPALERDNVAGFNCSYLPIDHPRAFDELMYILLCGTGVGFSVERQYVDKLPEVAHEFHPTDTTIVVADSKIGWAKALRQLLSLLWSGEVPQWDVSRVRPAGAPLKTFGGRASGPEPLVSLFKFVTELFQKAAGRRLSDLECHDIACKIAESVVVGGVRRSALISLSNPTSGRLRGAKSGQWWVDNPQRSLANNSAVYNSKPDFEFFLDEMRALYESKSGERGMFSREACRKVAQRNGRRDHTWDFGTNPCSEIILRPNQFCNLSEVVCRPEDTEETLTRKVRQAAILGTLQSTLTDFRYLRPIWRKNTEEEALLGVSLTGIMDCPILRVPTRELEGLLNRLKAVAVETNAEWAARLGVNQSVAVTCVKPSGTVSQLTDSASGIHPRHSEYYIRRIRGDEKDPVSKFLLDSGVPTEVDENQPGTVVHAFPQCAPEGAPQQSAMEQLELWSVYAEHWCEHKPSITVYYSDDEFLQVAAWLWENFDKASGLSFLPRSEHTYSQAPYEEVSQEVYQTLVDAFPILDWSKLQEEQDLTIGSQELACTGGACELP